MTDISLADFLLARIAEDEEKAREADGPRWLHQDKVVTFEVFGPDNEWTDTSAPMRVDTRANGHHIINWSPARVLAECEAKRRIVERYALCLKENRRAWEDYSRWIESKPTPDNPPSRSTHESEEIGLQIAAHLLALPYADHPDFRDEWRP